MRMSETGQMGRDEKVGWKIEAEEDAHWIWTKDKSVLDISRFLTLPCLGTTLIVSIEQYSRYEMALTLVRVAQNFDALENM